MREIIINPIRIAYTTEDGKWHAEEIAKAFQNILTNKKKEINQGGKIMNGQAMQEQSSVARINDLLEEVDKWIYSLDNDIHEINKRLLPSIPPPRDMESKDLAKDTKVEMKISHQEGWFVQTIVKLETIRNHLRGIDKEKIQKLKKAIGLLGPESKDLREEDGGTKFNGRIQPDRGYKEDAGC